MNDKNFFIIFDKNLFIIFGTIVFVVVFSITIMSYFDNIDAQYGYTGKSGWINACIDNKWFYSHSIKQCNELGVTHDIQTLNNTGLYR